MERARATHLRLSYGLADPSLLQEGVRLVAGLTGTVEIDPRPERRFRSNQRASVSLWLSRSLREWVGRIWR